MSRTRSHLDALLEKRNLSGGERLASLNRSIELIEQKLSKMGGLNAKNGPLSQPNTTGSTFAELENRLSRLTGELANNGHQSPSGPAYSNDLQPRDFVAEIAERKRKLSAFDPANTPSSSFSSTPGNAGSPFSGIDDLAEKIEFLRRDLNGNLSGLQQKVSEISQPSTTDELDRIAEGIRELQQAPRFDPSAFDALHNDLDDLRMSLGSAARSEELTSSVGNINTRLDQIATNIPETESRILSEIKQRMDEAAKTATSANADILNAKFDALNESVNNISGSLELDRFDEHLQGLVGAVELLAKKPQSPEKLEPSLEAIENRLDEITRAIVAVSVNERPVAETEPQVVAPALDRLEKHLVELAQGVEAIAGQKDDAQIDRLASQMDNIARQLEILDSNIQNSPPSAQPVAGDISNIESQLQELANHLTSEAEEKQRDEDQLAQLTDRIEGLAHKLGSFETAAQFVEKGDAAVLPATIDTSRIESYLQELANKIDLAVGADSTDQQLQNLEDQIAAIAEKLGNENQQQPANEELEGRLERIEQHIVADRDLTLDAITQATRSAMENLGNDGLSEEIIGALSEDLNALREIANQSETNTTRNIFAVQDTINGIVERLGSIENYLVEEPVRKTSIANASMAPSAAIGAQESELVGAGVSSGQLPNTLEKIDAAPSIDPSASLEPASNQVVEDNRPLEPGSGAPDISSLVKKASQEFSGDSEETIKPVEKTDFVAAARRAAQSAVAEVQAVTKESKSEPAKASLLSHFSKIPRKPIIVAAAAILLAIVAFAGSKMLPGSAPDSSAVVKIKPSPNKSSVVSAPMTKTPKAPAREARQAVSNIKPEAAKPGSAGDNMPESKTATRSEEQGFVVNSKPQYSQGFVAASDAGATSKAVPAKPPQESSLAMTSSQAPKTMPPADITTAPLADAKVGPVTLRQAAAKGDVRAQHEIAMRYTSGTGVNRNMETAAEWFERAASQEFAPAQYRLGSLYEKGLGVKKDRLAAANWYRRAAEQGNARAMHNLAVISALGANGKPDIQEGLTWFTKAAELGVKDSQFNLGIIYGQGMEGIKQDLAESYKWFALVAKTGDTDAAKKRDVVANGMDPKALDKARIAVGQWQPQELDRSANRVVIPEEWRKKSATEAASLTGKPAIRLTQTMLNKLGYKAGKADGIIGPKTRQAIVSFQKKAGLAPTGAIDSELLKTLQGLSI